MSKWVSQSSYVANNHTLLNDARHSADALRNGSLTGLDLHTVCAVLYLESEQANSALPTPDRQATTLLAEAYDNLGAGANVCYDAAHNAAKRDRALQYLTRGVGANCPKRRRVSRATRRANYSVVEGRSRVAECRPPESPSRHRAWRSLGSRVLAASMKRRRSGPSTGGSPRRFTASARSRKRRIISWGSKAWLTSKC